MSVSPQDEIQALRLRMTYIWTERQYFKQCATRWGRKVKRLKCRHAKVKKQAASTCAWYEREHTGLASQLALRRAQVSCLESELDELADQARTAELVCRDEHVDLQAQLQDLQTENAGLKNHADLLDAENADLKHAIAILEDENDIVTDKLSLFGCMLSKCYADLAQYEGGGTDLQQESGDCANSTDTDTSEESLFREESEEDTSADTSEESLFREESEEDTSADTSEESEEDTDEDTDEESEEDTSEESLFREDMEDSSNEDSESPDSNGYSDEDSDSSDFVNGGGDKLIYVAQSSSDDEGELCK